MARWLLLLAATLVIVPMWTDSAWSQDKNGKPAVPAAKKQAKPEDPFDDPNAGDLQSDEEAKPWEKTFPEEVPSVEALLKQQAQEMKRVSRCYHTRGAQSMMGEKPNIPDVLDRLTSIELTEKPLTDLADHIQQEHNIPVALDNRALKDVGIDDDTLITAAISEIPLRDALDLILQDLNLTWTIKSGVLLITTEEEEESHLITKCYDVVDLLVATSNRPYRNHLPTCNPSASGSPTVYPGSMGMGGSAGMHTMPSGQLSQMTGACQADFDTLIEMITSTTQPTSWDQVGGSASIAPIGNLLVINQTLRIHNKIEALLTDIREKREIDNTLVVELHWLWLDASQHEQLMGNAKPTTAGRTSLAVDTEALKELLLTVPCFHGQIACSNGQLVHLASGDRHSIITGAIPVIGSGVAYQPVIEIPNVGVVLELRATAVPGVDAALLNVQNTVTRLDNLPPPTRIGASWPSYKTTEGSNHEGSIAQETVEQPGGSASAPVDQPVMPTQQLATTARVPLGRPVILGAITFSPTGTAGLDEATENPTQLYLIATTRIATLDTEDEPKKP